MNDDYAEQENLSKFVAANVLANQTHLVDSILKCWNPDLFDLDDVENYYLSDRQILDMYRPSYPANEFSDEEVIKEIRDNGEDIQEIYEWWLVEARFATKLRERGEPVLEWGLSFWWGRTCTGQAISMDFIIEEIYEGMK